jgi:hypothetical protein
MDSLPYKQVATFGVGAENGKISALELKFHIGSNFYCIPDLWFQHLSWNIKKFLPIVFQ